MTYLQAEADRIIAGYREQAARHFAEEGDVVDLDLARSVTKEIGRIIDPSFLVVAFDVDDTIYLYRIESDRWTMEVTER